VLAYIEAKLTQGKKVVYWKKSFSAQNQTLRFYRVYISPTK